MRLVLSLILSCALFLTAVLSASHALVHGSGQGHGDMAQVDVGDVSAAFAECCDTTTGRSMPTCGFDASLVDPALVFDPTVTVLRHTIVQARAPTDRSPDTLLDPPKV